jgi:hypothetical protein
MIAGHLEVFIVVQNSKHGSRNVHEIHIHEKFWRMDPPSTLKSSHKHLHRCQLSYRLCLEAELFVAMLFFNPVDADYLSTNWHVFLWDVLESEVSHLYSTSGKLVWLSTQRSSAVLRCEVVL